MHERKNYIIEYLTHFYLGNNSSLFEWILSLFYGGDNQFAGENVKWFVLFHLLMGVIIILQICCRIMLVNKFIKFSGWVFYAFIMPYTGYRFVNNSNADSRIQVPFNS